MTACLRPLCALALAALLGACGSQPTSPLGELPRTPDATIEQQLQRAEAAQPEQAALLRLSAADQAYQKGDFAQARRILQRVPQDSLKPAQQIFAGTLQAELELQRGNHQAALRTLAHPSFAQLPELPVKQQVRSHLARAHALEADGQHLAAARERSYVAPLLETSRRDANDDAIWGLVSQLKPSELKATGDQDLDGWLDLAALVRSGALQRDPAALDAWRQQNPQHPAARRLPADLVRLQEVASQPLERIALLLPEQGQLASVARALRDGFLAAHYQTPDGARPEVLFYDSAQLRSMEDFYARAQADGVQLVVGPLEKPLVRQLASKAALPLPTLALNYADPGQSNPPQLVQFGLAAEDEAREVSRRAWEDGHRRAIALVPRGDWGNRVLDAFRESWQAQGGTLIATTYIDQPVELARQIGEVLQLRQSEARASRVRNALGEDVVSQPSIRQDVDFVFLAATPQQAQQVKPTLAFQYAGDLPVYATSHLFSGNPTPAQLADLEGIRFCETPWLLGAPSPLRDAAVRAWPQSNGSLGRLYAMGADAHALALQLQRLQVLAGSHLDGLSGTLSLSAGQRVERRLPWAEFREGRVAPLSPTY